MCILHKKTLDDHPIGVDDNDPRVTACLSGIGENRSIASAIRSESDGATLNPRIINDETAGPSSATLVVDHIPREEAGGLNPSKSAPGSIDCPGVGIIPVGGDIVAAVRAGRGRELGRDGGRRLRGRGARV